MLTKLSKQLREFGLSDKEITVYVSLLKDGSDTAANIAKKANLNRSTTYVQLEALMGYGLISTYKKHKKTYFSPESPQNVKHLIEQKIKKLEEERDNIENLIPELTELYASLGETADVKLFHGKEALKTMRNSIINSGTDKLNIMYNADHLYTLYESSELLEFSKKRAGKKIYTYGLYNKKGKPFSELYRQSLLQLDRKKYPIDADIYVYGDTVSLASTTGKIVGVTIKNKQIASSLHTLFELAFHTSDYLTKMQSDDRESQK